METIKLKIEYQLDKDRIVMSLANNGYKVWVEENDDDNSYYVCFELAK